MGTRSRIGIENADNTITSIYTHWDGYIRHHGPILLRHYDTEAKVRALIALGDLSVLGKELGEKHDFDAPSDETTRYWCRAYGRDRGEDSPAKVSANKAEFRKFYAEYRYLFVKGKWKVLSGNGSHWRDLHKALVTERLTT